MKQNFKLIKSVIFTFLLLTLTTTQLFAQTTSPGIFFQAVARDAYSNPAKDRKIYVQSNILQTSATGTIVLTETHQTKTDATGVFAISIGQGTRIGGTANGIANIAWAQGPFYLNLKISIEPVAPATTWDYTKDWIDLGTTPLGTVPYALYAGSVAGFDTKLNITDTTKMLSPYAKVGNLNSLIANKINLADSATIYVTPTQLNARIVDPATSLATKVDKVTGKDLSSNDYTTAEKTKLAAITGTNTGDQDLSSYATTTALALKANLVSPTFTGTPLSTTASVGTNTTQIATTAFVQNALLNSSAASGLLGAIWTSSTTGTLNGVGFTISSARTATPSNWDLSTSDFSAAPLSASQNIGTVSHGDDWVVTFSSPITNLKLYLRYWRTASYVFNQSLSILSGSGITSPNSTTISVSGWGNGIIQFAGPVTSLTVNSSADLINDASSQLLTFGVIPLPAAGSGEVARTTSPTFVTPNLGTPASVILTNATALPLTTGVTGILPIANGGTGLSTVGTTGQILSTTAAGTLSWTTLPSSVSSIGAIAGSSTANGASISSGVLSLTPADGSNGGIVTTGTQTIAGDKTFLGNIQVNGSAKVTSNMLIGSGSSNPSAILTANSTTQGFLPPRLTIQQRDAIINPAQGLVLYCVNCGQYGELEVYNGSSWTNIVGGAASSIFQDKVYHYSRYSSVSGVYAFNGTTWSSVVTNGMPSNFYGDYYVGKIGNKSYYYVYSSSVYTLYSFDGTNWVSLSIDKPSWFYGSSYLGVVGNKVYHQRNIWNNITQKNDAEIYSFDGTAWTLISTTQDVRSFSSYSYVGIVNNKIYHFQNIGTTSDDFKLFEFNGTGWTMLSNAPPRYFSSSSYLGTINNKVYHFQNIGTISNDFKVYEFDGTTWTMLSVAPPQYFGNTSYLGVIGNKAYHYVSVWNPATSTSENYLYQFDGLNWTTVLGTNYPVGAYFGGWLSGGMMSSSSLIN